jgi:nitroreductase
MDTLNCLTTRRSVRFYKTDPIPDSILSQIIIAANFAPSSKNTRPWEYVILTGQEKDDICNIIIEEYPHRGKPFRKRDSIQPITQATNLDDLQNFSNAKVMTNIGSTVFIRQAPVLILIFNQAPYTAGENNVISEISPEALLAHDVEIESCSNFIFSLLLSAHDLGLGGCWIADANFCRDKIKSYIGTTNDLVAGVVLGYPTSSVPPKKISPSPIKYFKKQNFK